MRASTRPRQREVNLLARYARNHNAVLDPPERQAMEADPAYQREQSAWPADQQDRQCTEVIQRFDRNADRELDREELEFLRGQIIEQQGGHTCFFASNRLFPDAAIVRPIPQDPVAAFCFGP